MDRRERTSDPVESLRAALEGKLAELWTALPGIVESFNPQAVTVVVQPSIKGHVQNELGQVKPVNLPLLVDVPAVFPCGGGFTLTYPIKKGDECLVVFASRCIDGWWQNGGIGGTPDERMHDLSDGFAIVGPRSQTRTLNPAVDVDNVQLRTDDGQAHITIMPDYTIRSQTPTSMVTQAPGGKVTAEADTEINLVCPVLNIRANSIKMQGKDGGRTTATLDADIEQTGWHRSTGDQVAGGKSLMHHTHPGDSGGTTGEPI